MLEEELKLMEVISAVMLKVIGALLLVTSLTACSTISSNVKDEHANCMYMLLDNANPGESCKWSDGKNQGTVTVAMIKPNLCHVMISTIENGRRSKSWQDTACYTKDNKWKFYSQ